MEENLWDGDTGIRKHRSLRAHALLTRQSER